MGVLAQTFVPVQEAWLERVLADKDARAVGFRHQSDVFATMKAMRWLVGALGGDVPGLCL
jgi:hypothetical protein